MAHESFENKQIAEVLNKNYISIKVDREEMPHIDNIYMSATQLMTGRGGWPLTIFATPDKIPFFCGTYFPPRSRPNQHGFYEIISSIANVWQKEKENILKSAAEINNALNKEEKNGALPNKNIIKKTIENYKISYDKYNHGFGNQPKFPTAYVYELLLNQNDKEIKKIALESIKAIGNGGIYDHIGYGIHRYSTDAQWLVPHFEKMLYDQAFFVKANIWAYQHTKDSHYKQKAQDTLEYVSDKLTHKDGAFYSAEDADSEGIEGKFYTWEKKEIYEILNEKESDQFCKYYNISAEGNFYDELTHSKTGKNIPYSSKKISKDILKKLYKEREKQVRPQLDDKILTDWNGLMISAFSLASLVFNEKKYLKIAENACSFLLKNLTDENKYLIKRWHSGEAKHPAHIDDYTFFIEGLLSLYKASLNFKYLSLAIDYFKIAEKEFWDTKNGAFFFTAKNTNTPIKRIKEFYDGAIPSANSIMINICTDLHHYTWDKKFLKITEQILKTNSHGLEKKPNNHSAMVNSFHKHISPKSELIIVGKIKPEQIKELLKKNIYLIIKNSKIVEETLPYTKDFVKKNDLTTYYLCSNYTCKKPSNDFSQIISSVG